MSPDTWRFHGENDPVNLPGSFRGVIVLAHHRSSMPHLAWRCIMLEREHCMLGTKHHHKASKCVALGVRIKTDFALPSSPLQPSRQSHSIASTLHDRIQEAIEILRARNLRKSNLEYKACACAELNDS